MAAQTVPEARKFILQAINLPNCHIEFLFSWLASTSSFARSAVNLNRSVPANATASLSSIPQNLTNLRPTQSKSSGLSLIAFWYSKLRSIRVSTVPVPNSTLRILNKWSRTPSRSLSSASPAFNPASTAKNNNQPTSSSIRSSPTTLEEALKGFVFMTSAGYSRATICRNCIASFSGEILDIFN